MARASHFEVKFSKLPLKIGFHLQWKVEGVNNSERHLFPPPTVDNLWEESENC